VQTCIVHLIRNSLAFVSWKDRKAILPAIKAIYRAENADMAMVRVEEFEAERGKRYPAIGQAWRRAWEHVVPFFAFAPVIRKMIYTTNAVEALHRSLRKIIKTRGSFPNDDAALKLLYLTIRNAGMRWRRPGGFHQTILPMLRQRCLGAVSQNATAFNAKMPMPIHTRVMIRPPNLDQTTPMKGKGPHAVDAAPLN